MKAKNIFMLFIMEIFMLGTLISIPQSSAQAQAIPELKVMTNDNNEQSLIIKKLKIDVKVVGNLAITTMDMVFSNNFPEDNRQYEGKLIFPLADGQSINRLAMDFNGVMREGVVVEKNKGRVVFEEIERQQVDPALLEKTSSNNYKLRVYPIFSKKDKHIIIAYEEVLKGDNASLSYNLPLNFSYPIEDFSLKADVFADYPVHTSNSNQMSDIQFSKVENAYTSSVHYKNYVAKELFGFTIPLPEDRKDVICEKLDGESFFVVNRNMDIPDPMPFKAEAITLLWDCSFSSKNRAFAREYAILEAFFKHNKNCSVELITFNYKIKVRKDFQIRNGDFSQLKSYLESIKYDGGSNFDCLNLGSNRADLALLFSDGISNLGNSKFINSKIPVYTINSNLMCNSPYLSEVSLRTGGNYLNLLAIDEEKAISLLTNYNYRLISVDYNPAELSEVFPTTSMNMLDGLTIAGKMNANTASITLNYGYRSKVMKSEKIMISQKTDMVSTNILPRIWAKKKLDYLQIDKKSNKDEILKIGTKYSIVSDETSLIILENASDYLRYKITPPKSDTALYAGYQAYLNNMRQADPEEAENSKSKYDIKRLISEFGERKVWYQTDFKKKAEKIKKEKRENLDNLDDTSYYSSVESTSTSSVENASPQSSPMLMGRSSERRARQAVGASAAETGIMADQANINEESKAEVTISAYNSNAPYFKDFRSKNADFWQLYYANKEKYGNTIGYYIDIAELLSESKNNSEAAEIITNILELSEENQEFLRIVAYKLQYLGELDLAIKLLEYIKEIRPEEPQSYRDLAMALNDKGEYQRACDLLYEMALINWDGRFHGLNLTAIIEMNGIISKNPKKVQTAKYNPELIFPMPLDMRVVLRWDLDNTDIDLWVTDPNKEKCYYGYKETIIGGMLPQDLTGGYGPEEFMLKNAIKGKYILECNYFGSRAVQMTGGATVFLDLYTNYGKANETKSTMILRLKENKETAKIGVYDFK